MLEVPEIIFSPRRFAHFIFSRYIDIRDFCHGWLSAFIRRLSLPRHAWCYFRCHELRRFFQMFWVCRYLLFSFFFDAAAVCRYLFCMLYFAVIYFSLFILRYFSLLFRFFSSDAISIAFSLYLLLAYFAFFIFASYFFSYAMLFRYLRHFDACWCRHSFTSAYTYVFADISLYGAAPDFGCHCRVFRCAYFAIAISMRPLDMSLPWCRCLMPPTLYLPRCFMPPAITPCFDVDTPDATICCFMPPRLDAMLSMLIFSDWFRYIVCITCHAYYFISPSSLLTYTSAAISDYYFHLFTCYCFAAASSHFMLAAFMFWRLSGYGFIFTFSRHYYDIWAPPMIPLYSMIISPPCFYSSAWCCLSFHFHAWFDTRFFL